MDFYDIVRQVLELLQCDGRTTYRALKRQFDLDDEALDDLKEELRFAHPVIDADGRGLVWTGVTAQEATPPAGQKEQPSKAQNRDPASYKLHSGREGSALECFLIPLT